MHQNTSSTHFTDYTHRSCAPCMNPRKIVATVLKGSACIAAQQMLNTYADINNKINSQLVRERDNMHDFPWYKVFRAYANVSGSTLSMGYRKLTDLPRKFTACSTIGKRLHPCIPAMEAQSGNLPLMGPKHIRYG